MVINRWDGYENILDIIWNKDKYMSDIDINDGIKFEIGKTIEPKDILYNEIANQEKKLRKIKEFHDKF